MRRNPNPPAILYLSLYLTVVLLLGGCGILGSRENKPAGKPHLVTLTWVPSTSPVVGYNVYRAMSADGPVIRLTPQPVPATQYTDLNVEAGKNYVYYLTSVDFRGTESKPSNNISVTVPAP